MSMANVTKTTRIQAIAELQKRKTEIQNRLQNGQSQDSTTIGGNSFTEDEWKKIIQKMDEYLTEVKQEQKERFEKRDKEKEIQQFYEKMKMAEQYKKPQAEKLTIQKHLDGEDIAPYSYLAEDGVITYNGVSFFCDYENNAITLGDMSDEKNVITVQLENGGCLKVNRDNIEDLSKAIAMFSPEDIRRILVALQQDAKVRQMQQEIEQDKIVPLCSKQLKRSLSVTAVIRFVAGAAQLFSYAFPQGRFILYQQKTHKRSSPLFLRFFLALHTAKALQRYLYNSHYSRFR